MHGARQTRRAFTLVELLTVIAILSLLAALLLPAAMRARERALETACQSNLRQAGIRLLNYMIEEDLAGVGGGAEGEWITLPCGCTYWYPEGGVWSMPFPVEGCPKAGPNPLYGLTTNDVPATLAYGIVDLKQYAFLPPGRQWLLTCSAADIVTGPADLAGERHRGRVNVFFSDGHAEPMATNAVPFAPPPS